MRYPERADGFGHAPSGYCAFGASSTHPREPPNDRRIDARAGNVHLMSSRPTSRANSRGLWSGASSVLLVHWRFRPPCLAACDLEPIRSQRELVRIGGLRFGDDRRQAEREWLRSWCTRLGPIPSFRASHCRGALGMRKRPLGTPSGGACFTVSAVREKQRLVAKTKQRFGLH